MQQHQAIMEININGVMNGIYAVLPGMRSREQGTIINISSVADRSVRPMLATYAASKVAVKSLTESLRAANAKYGIRFCNLAPAKIRTPMIEAANLSQEQTIEVEDFVKAVLWTFQQPQGICIRDMVFAPTYYEP